MNFSNFFIRRPIFAGVLSSVIFLVGLIAMRKLPISEYPEIVPPTIVVRASYPGANPKTIAETVASPLEQSFRRQPYCIDRSQRPNTDPRDAGHEKNAAVVSRSSRRLWHDCAGGLARTKCIKGPDGDNR